MRQFGEIVAEMYPGVFQKDAAMTHDPTNPADPGYGERYRSGLTCGCGEPAGTAWGPYFCPTCDQERLARIDRSLERIAASLGKEASA